MATGALGIMAGAGLSGCAPQQRAAAAPQQEAGASAGEVHEVDAVSPRAWPRTRHTTFTETQLQDAVMAYQTECVVSTSNEDGTPNIAIFVPAAMIDGTYVASPGPKTRRRRTSSGRRSAGSPSTCRT
ncbi:MAG: hypothetical protein ACLSVD_14290 [Eggerthellaceae bacterium]